MKYIRTKDGNNLIIELYNMKLPYNIVDNYIDFNSFGRFEILKQADTIEELCDEFVVSGNTFRGKPFVSVKPFKTLQEQNDIRLYENCELFGAIWTDKGLIYVAKMNDKGELELL